MPAPGWASITVREETEKAIEGLRGEIVDVGGKPMQLRTADEVVSAAVECLSAHRRRRRQ